MVRDPALLLVVGMIVLAEGPVIVLAHNIWSGGLLPIVITLIGWLLVIRGTLLMVLSPAAIVHLFDALNFEKLYFPYAIVSLAIGLYLTYSGFRR